MGGGRDVGGRRRLGPDAPPALLPAGARRRGLVAHVALPAGLEDPALERRRRQGPERPQEAEGAVTQTPGHQDGADGLGEVQVGAGEQPADERPVVAAPRGGLERAHHRRRVGVGLHHERHEAARPVDRQDVHERLAGCEVALEQGQPGIQPRERLRHHAGQGPRVPDHDRLERFHAPASWSGVVM